ncbi:MAG: hypothetical protein MIO92_06305 [Methanosarcinaceae archaeon]|nr:hypothetical protein [Methanosarcinaceae archaeon]
MNKPLTKTTLSETDLKVLRALAQGPDSGSCFCLVSNLATCLAPAQILYRTAHLMTNETASLKVKIVRLVTPLAG